MIRAVALVFSVLVAVSGVSVAEVQETQGHAQRIVALAPHLAEAAYFAGAGAKLVGVSRFSRLPASTGALPQVADAGHIDVERVLALRPDLVLGWRSGNPALQIARLERLGLHIVLTEVRTLDDIPRLVRDIGSLAGTSGVAERRARQFESELAEIRARFSGARPVSVFLEIWHRPMLTVGGEHLISDAIRSCGARNAFGNTAPITVRVSRERLLWAQPDAIITSGYGSEAHEAWRGLERIPAVHSGRIYAVDAELLHAQGPRVLEGVRALCARLELARR